ncbi:MAG TPA: translocation/assembly module TamB domain-containing protein [Steroidobacteraceae bacterium]|nr:translocation/assembly module TamB domain-containing protein [Steroidobacteraceae bacterium]
MRRTLRIAAWSVGALALLIVLLIAAVLVAGNTQRGRELIERVTLDLTKGDVRLEGLAGAFPSRLELARLEVSDEQGVWLTADHISLQWSPLDFIRWYVKVQRVRAAQVDVRRRPVSRPPHHRGKLHLPQFDVADFTIDALVLEPALAGMRADLKVRGSGHLDSLEDARLDVRGSGHLESAEDARIEYDVHLRLDPARMDANLKLEEPAGGPLEHLARLPGLGALEVTGSLAGPRTAEAIELNARAGDLHVQVRGTLDLHGREGTLEYSAESPQLAPRPGLAWQHLDIEGRWTGSLRTPQASGAVSVDGLQLPEGARLASLRATLSASGGALNVDATVRGLAIPHVPPQLLAASPLRVAATLHLDEAGRPLELTLDQRLVSLRAQAVTAGARSVAFTITLPDLSPFAALARQGDVRGKATVSGKLAQRSGTVRLEMGANAAFGAPRRWAGLLGRTARAQVSASLTDQALTVERLSVTGAALSFSASGRAQRVTASAGRAGTQPSRGPATGAVRELRGRWSLELPSLAALSPDFAGKLQATGQFAGAPRLVGAEMQAAATLSIRGSPTSTVAMNVQAHGLPSAPTAAIEAKGSFLGAPVQLDAFFERSRSDTYHLEIQRTDWKSAHLEADLTTGTDLSQGRGSLKLRIDRLADLAPLVGRPLQGSLTGGLGLSPDGGRTHVQLELDAHDIGAGQLTTTAKLTGSGPIDAVRLSLAAQSEGLRSGPARLGANAQLDVPARVLELSSAQVSYHGQSLRLLSPARIAFASGLQLSKVRLGAEHAVLEVAGELAPALELRASLSGVDAHLVNAFVPHLLAQGSLRLETRLHGTLSAPLGRARLAVSALRFGDPGAAALPLLDLRVTAQLMGTTAQLDAALHAGRASQLTITGRAPLNAQSTVDLKLAGKLDVAFANAFLEAHGERAAGTLSVNATVTGPAQDAEIGGSVELTHGDIRDYTQGIHLGDITAHLVGGQGILKIASLTAHAGSGDISMTGTFGVLERGMPIDLRLTARNAQPITNDILTANLNADMSAKGTLRERLEIAGTLRVNRALIGIPNSLPPNVQVLNVIRPGQAPPAPVVHRLVIGLDIAVDAPREILVQGRGLNAELGGEVRIRGTTLKPVVSGGFQMLRGSFSLASARLNFTMGDVSFNGAGLRRRIDPTLDFTASATAADATVTLHISGFADAPRFELSSSPPLPQDEILARLLFGEPAAQLTAVQLAEIGAALVSLTGVGGGGLNPLEKVQKALGLNVLTVGSAPNTGTNPNQNTGAAVTAGRYVTSRVFVAATQSTTGVSQLQVDVDLTKHLKLQTRLGNGTATAQGVTPENDPGSSIGITYQFQY